MSVCVGCGTVIDNDECQCSVVSSDTIEVTGSGKTGKPFLFDTILNPDPNNLLSIAVDGLLGKLPDDLIVPPQAYAYRSTNQSLANDTNTIITLDSERYDTDGMHSTVTNTERLTFQTAGLYLCIFRCAFAGNVTGDRWAYLRRNSRWIMAGQARKALNTITFEMDMCVVSVEAFAAGEYIHAEAKQDSGGALNVVADRSSPILTAKWLRSDPRV